MISLNSKTTFIVENTDTKKLDKIFLVIKSEELLIDNVSQNLALIDNEQYKWSEMSVKTEHFIGYLDNNSLYALELEDESSLIPETSLKPFRTLLEFAPGVFNLLNGIKKVNIAVFVDLKLQCIQLKKPCSVKSVII